MGDTLKIFGRTYPNTNGFKAEDEYGNVLMFTKGGITSIWQDDDGAIVLNDENGTDKFTADDFVQGTIKGDIVLTSTTSIRTNAFYQCTNMTSVTGVNVVTINSSAFYGCTKLKSIYFPNVNRLYASQCFMGCASLKTACFPKLGVNTTVPYMYSQTFRNCTSLEIADLGCVSQCRAYEFQGCTVFNKLILRNTENITSLGNINVFTDTPFASGGSGGSIYVPSALIESYKSATNWSTLYSYGTVTWIPIEGSEYEHYYADGTEVTS